MKSTTVKPAHKSVKQYYQALEEYASQEVSHEMAVRSAFQHLLEDTGRRFGWMLIAELVHEDLRGPLPSYSRGRQSSPVLPSQSSFSASSNSVPICEQTR